MSAVSGSGVPDRHNEERFDRIIDRVNVTAAAGLAKGLVGDLCDDIQWLVEYIDTLEKGPRRG